jgi:hypothetical protein
VPRPSALTQQQSGNEQALQQILSKTVMLHRWEFRRCYNDTLRTEPSLKGTIVIETTVAPSGDPVVVKDRGSTMPSPATIECVKAVFTRIEYAPWLGTAATIVVPLAFDRATAAEEPTE